MTLHLPLRSEPSPSPQPSFLVAPANHAAQLARAVHAIMKARRIVVICGPFTPTHRVALINFLSRCWHLRSGWNP